MTKILYLGGPPGAGKSTFASEFLKKRRGWLHLEIDRFDEGDGIDIENLRPEWNDYFINHRPEPLHQLLQQRSHGYDYAVLTFSSALIFNPQHIKIAEHFFYFAYL